MLVALFAALFWHGVINAIASHQQTDNWLQLQTMLLNFRLGDVFASHLFWDAQFSGFLNILEYPTLWLSWLWIPVSVAIVILLQAVATLTNIPRWLVSLLLLALGILAMWGLPQTSGGQSPQGLAHAAHVALYLAIAALYISATRLRGHQSH
ncbi:hypothetical protein B0I24_105120 [Aliidiomarina maris]|nr:hypothetical protein B0I24_105120 [Aliidiomarina maris]